MAIKTMAAGGGEGKFDEGWHEVTIETAEYGVYTNDQGDKRYITISFEGYPDNMDLRIYEVFNKTTDEEFKIAGLFKYAHAGIIAVLKDPTGKKPVIQYDDEAKNLVGKRVIILFYKEKKTGNGYTRIFDRVAPIEQEGEHITWTADQVSGIKAGIEKGLQQMFERTAPLNGTTEGITSENASY